MKALSATLLALALFAPHAQAGTPLAAGAGEITTDDGVRLHYTVGGQGPVALFLHGGPGSGAESFRALAGPVLGGDYTVVWLDQRGSGASASAANGDYALQRQIADFEQVRKALKVDRWTAVGYSFGGLMAQGHTLQSPGTTQSLVLINALLNLPQSMQSTTAYGRTLLPTPTVQAIDAAGEPHQQYFSTLALLQKAKQDWRLQYASGQSRDRALAVLERMPARNHDMGQKMFQAGPGAYLHDWGGEAPKVQVPVLVIAGEEDHVVGERAYTQWRFPHKTEVLLPGRHNVVVEAPARVQQAIHRFARDTRVPASR